MKFGDEQLDLDAIDRHILSLLQENCRVPLAKIAIRSACLRRRSSSA
jgi:DNA-binding Lrp family transcriptional regulator